MRTHAVWAGDAWVENWTFDLSGTVCAPAAAGRPSFYASGLGSHFPDDPFVARWQVDSAHILPLRDVTGEIRGVLLMMDEAVMTEALHLEPILTVFAERAAAELARLTGQAALQRFSDEQAALYAGHPGLIPGAGRTGQSRARRDYAPVWRRCWLDRRQRRGSR